jgi:hypothetical protein
MSRFLLIRFIMVSLMFSHLSAAVSGFVFGGEQEFGEKLFMRY